jgi:hypothetical protein
LRIYAKIISLTDPNRIRIGEDGYIVLPSQMKMKFKEVNYGIEHWNYANRKTDQIYKLYTLLDLL